MTLDQYIAELQVLSRAGYGSLRVVKHDPYGPPRALRSTEPHLPEIERVKLRTKRELYDKIAFENEATTGEKVVVL